MPLAYNEKTGEVIIYMKQKFISKEAAMKMFGGTPRGPKKKGKKPEKKE
jgi:hypothetical protein